MNEDLYDHLKRLSNEEHTHGIVAIRFQNLVFFLCIRKRNLFWETNWGFVGANYIYYVTSLHPPPNSQKQQRVLCV